MPKSGERPDDLLEDSPPQPPSKTRMSANTLPKGSRDSESAASGALSVMGMQPIMKVVSGMAELEKLVKDLSLVIPAISTAAAPFIAQMRDLGAAALADMAQGGTGGVDLGTGAPPPMMPGSGPAPGMGGGMAPGMMGGGEGPMMMPPPPG